jgi:predicted nucleic acid-binding Zn ribbon protein
MVGTAASNRRPAVRRIHRPTMGPDEKLPSRRCVVCGRSFVPKTRLIVACSETCRATRKLDMALSYRQRRPDVEPTQRGRRGGWGCPVCAGLPHRRPEGKPCRCGGSFSPREEVRASASPGCGLAGRVSLPRTLLGFRL